MQDSTELFREPGQAYLSPSRFASTLELDLSTLAGALGVHRNTLRLHPENARAQKRLRDYIGVYMALIALDSDIKRTAFHMKNTPIRILGYRTLFEVVKSGETKKALLYLRTISGGQNG